MRIHWSPFPRANGMLSVEALLPRYGSRRVTAMLKTTGDSDAPFTPGGPHAGRWGVVDRGRGRLASKDGARFRRCRQHRHGGPGPGRSGAGLPPGGEFRVYLTGLAFIAAGAGFVVERRVRLAAWLLAVLFLVSIATLHFPALIVADDLQAA